MAITRTPIVDDDGTGTTGTVIDNAWKQQFYDQIDAALGALVGAEGVWTPSLNGSGGSSGITYTNQDGVYTKLGRRVFINGRIALSAMGTVTGQLGVVGLPFPSENVAGHDIFGIFVQYWNGAAAIGYMAGVVPINASSFALWKIATPASALSAVTQADMTNTFRIDFSGSYLAAT
jgi:hypothetical protein